MVYIMEINYFLKKILYNFIYYKSNITFNNKHILEIMNK